jgi:hypothetical protein
MIANFLFVPYCPEWASLITALDVVVIWGVVLVRREAAKR